MCGNELGYVDYRYEFFRCKFCEKRYPTVDIVREKQKGKKR